MLFKCPKCKELKPDNDFRAYANNRRTTNCKSCRENSRIGEGKRIAQNKKAMTYIILNRQESKCAICSKELKINLVCGSGFCETNLDHDHTNNQVRGVLCGGCNRALGLFQDDPNILEQALLYLSFHKETERKFIKPEWFG